MIPQGDGSDGGPGPKARRGPWPPAGAGPDADPQEIARAIVLRLLTGQARTRQELADALRRRNVPTDAAEAVLNRMTEVGLVNDEDFAHAWVESRQQRRQLSRTGLRRELQRKGVDRELVERAIDQVSGEDERETARALAEKKLRSVRGLDPVVQRRRISGALARRGFSGEVVSSVLRELAVGAADGDSQDTLP